VASLLDDAKTIAYMPTKIRRTDHSARIVIKNLTPASRWPERKVDMKKATKRPSVQANVGQCEDCEGTGWYGDNGSGIIGNSEFVRCDCGTGDRCRIGCHPYIVIGGVAWCGICDREADLEICRINHVLPNASMNLSGDEPE
jgi:hypothetical protein